MSIHELARYMVGLADALTHIGQINVLRRTSGNPAPKANVFLGRPPK